jgi:phospholipase C
MRKLRAVPAVAGPTGPPTRFALPIDPRQGDKERNISPWRRSVRSDLTTALDFTAHSGSRRLPPPGTARYRDTVHQQSRLPPPEVPTRPARELIAQEPGVRPARALLSSLDLELRPHADGVGLRFDNRSSAAVCCTADWEGTTSSAAITDWGRTRSDGRATPRMANIRP